MELKRQFVGVVTTVIAAGALAAGVVAVAPPGVFHDLINSGVGASETAESMAGSSVDSRVFHDL